MQIDRRNYVYLAKVTDPDQEEPMIDLEYARQCQREAEKYLKRPIDIDLDDLAVRMTREDVRLLYKKIIELEEGRPYDHIWDMYYDEFDDLDEEPERTLLEREQNSEG